MNLSDKTKENIHKAHFVNGIDPSNYLVKYRNIFELIQYRAHLQTDDVFIAFYPDSGERVQLTFGEFTEKVYRTANLLKAKGIGVGDRIATVSHNHINTVIQYFAAWSLGATVVPINVNEEPDRIKYILESSHTKLAFVKQEYLNRIKETAVELSIQIIIHGIEHSKEDEISFETEIEKHSDKSVPDDSVNQETEALIVYTSGTTGNPKGVVLTQYNLLADAEGISKWHAIDKGQTIMCVLPIHHVNGTIVTIVTPMFAGAKLILNQKFHTDKFFSRIAEENVQIVSVVPTLLQFLCHDFEKKPELIGEPAIQNFRHIICGAGPLTCELVSKFEKMFGLKIVHGYGLSETTCYSCFIPIDLSEIDHSKWLNQYGFPSIGIAIEPNEMDIHSDKGESLPENIRGEIVIRGHNVMKYYDENAEANDKTFEFGWFRSGDEGFYLKDEQGRKYFFITGRIKELIIRGGVNIAPLEIDEVLMGIPQVKAGIAVGFDNDWYGEEVGALVQLNDDVEVTDEMKTIIINKCKEKLPAYKTPKAIIFTDTIPVTSTGKYQRNKVKYFFEEFKTIQFK
ncbi:MAG: acyl--CoA ligase [Ignavibacteria bacterium]|nr:acyl--CoA ligase [Ignavibacteria bacterium]MCC7158396.1 acyl--CoA ligase [Ignavibacteria bacterium]